MSLQGRMKKGRHFKEDSQPSHTLYLTLLKYFNVKSIQIIHYTNFVIILSLHQFMLFLRHFYRPSFALSVPYPHYSTAILINTVVASLYVLIIFIRLFSRACRRLRFSMFSVNIYFQKAFFH